MKLVGWTLVHRDTAVPAEGNGDLQTLICVLVARPRRCLTLSNPVSWQNWMVAYLVYTLRMKTLFRVADQLWFMTRIREEDWTLMGRLLHSVQRVQNVAAHPSTASVPITVLQYNGPLLCGFNVGIKALIKLTSHFFVFNGLSTVQLIDELLYDRVNTFIGQCYRYDYIQGGPKQRGHFWCSHL